MKKKLCSIILLIQLFIVSSTKAQGLERRDSNRFFVSKEIASFDHAVSWKKNLLGEWEKYDRHQFKSDLNQIYKKEDRLGDSGVDPSLNSNFFKIQKHIVSYPGQDDMILILIDLLDGYYRYPFILQEWKSVRSLQIHLVSVTEMEKFSKKLARNTNKKVTTKIKSIRSGIFENDGKYSIDELVSKANNSYPLKITYLRLLNENSKSVRFDFARYFKENNPFFKSNFDESYFELPLSDFGSVFSPDLK